MAANAMAVVWFKRDLRIEDHRPLAIASQSCSQVLPFYCREKSIRALPDFGLRHATFIEEALFDLQNALKERGSDLLVTDGEVLETLHDLHHRFPFDHLFAHEETGNNATFRRDIAVARWCRENGVVFREFPQNGVQRGLTDRDGWARTWHQRMHEPLIQPPGRLPPFPRVIQVVPLSPPHRGITQPHEQGGRQAALATLDSFLRFRGKAYHREMSSPLSAETSCSRLSSYLAHGCLSMREVVQGTEGAKRAVKARERSGFPLRPLSSFLSRCHWHCHFMQKLEREPAIEFHCFNRACDELRERPANPETLERWQKGQTGFPYLDACMRFLDARGWINFRMRAMITSFAAYNLWIDWRDFKDWLACQFQDYEPGIHISQIQMQSGVTGINTLRIYNVIKQGHDQDPRGTFIRRWVPELSAVPDAFIHEPWKMPSGEQHRIACRIGRHYPAPIVDHKESIRHARSRFAEIRRDDAFWKEAARVQLMHGSRKSQEARPRRPQARKPETQLELSLPPDSEN